MAKSGYDMYLDKCLLPVTPQKLSIKITNQNRTVTLINEGEINLLKKAGLTEVEFECEIPQVKHPYAKYTNSSGFRKAEYFLNYFEQLKTSQKSFQFIVCRTKPNGSALFNTNITVALEDYKITEDVKEGFDLKVKIKLKQAPSYGTKTVKVSFTAAKPKAAPEPVRPSNPPANTSKSYKVGDIVNFKGGTHYVSSYSGAKGYSARAGQAKITIANGSGKTHPWHLIHTKSGSNVYGWVDDGTFE